MTEDEQAHRDGLGHFRQRFEILERRRRQTLLYLGNGIACFFLLGFGLAAIFTGHATLSAFALSHAAISLLNILLYRLTGNPAWATYGFSYGILAMFVYLLASGGVDQTGPLWAFPMVAASISLLGGRRGMMVVGLMSCIACLLFFMPPPWLEVAAYSSNFKLRFISTFAALALFTALHEYARARNQTDLMRVSTQLDRMSYADFLTGLPNRRHMLDRLESENSRFSRHRRPYAILYGDVDNFKRINDQFGHQTGDEVLKAIGKTIAGNMRQHDKVGRWGGEEFLVLLPETERQVAAEVAEKLRAAVAALQFSHDGQVLALSMSFGVQTIDYDGKIDAFIHFADEKLYHAKNTGKNRVVAELEQEAA